MIPRTYFAFVLAAAVTASFSCERKPVGGPQGAAPSSTAQGGGEPAGGSEPAADDSRPKFGTASISGVVKIQGEPPAPNPLDLSAKPECIKQRQDLSLGDLLSEKFVVGPDGGLQDCVVHITKGLPRGYRVEDMVACGHPEKVTLDQVGCHYVPHVFPIMVGQDLVVKNSDPFLHNVSIPAANYNASMPSVETRTESRFFRKAGPISAQCSVHPWMGAFAFVVQNPFFFKTGPDGKFNIEKLPPGEYTVVAWHETDRRLGDPKPQTITVAEGQAVENIEFVFTYKG